MVELFKTLGDVNRLRLINILMDEELCVCEIEVLLQMTQSNASRHLKKLRDQKIILSSKDAQWIHYRVNNQFIEANEDLFKFLKSKFDSGDIFESDLERMRKYRINHLDCSIIREDRERVLSLIGEERA